MNDDLMWVGGVLLLLFGLWFFSGGPTRQSSQSPFIQAPQETATINPGTTVITNPQPGSYDASNPSSASVDPRTSPYAGLIHLEQGNASGETSSNKEYVVIRADYNLSQPISITGWTLKNAGASRTYYNTGNINKGQTATAKIPYAVKVWTNSGLKQIVPIKLESNHRVYIITGSPLSFSSPYNVRDSFRVNKCSGYIQNVADYSFQPFLSTMCPAPYNDPDTAGLPEDCSTFVRSLGTCQSVDFASKADWCTLHASDQAQYDPICKLPSFCRNFVDQRYNYSSCLRLHQNDSDFLQPEWRVYLGAVWELWAAREETISLYDENGKLVDQLKY